MENMIENIFITDADTIQLTDKIPDILYRNTSVDDFFTEKRLGIQASKGMGKTFLLKLKRFQYQKDGIKCCPKDELVDSLTDVIVPHNLRKLYRENYKYWVYTWEIAIYLSVISLLDIALPNAKNLMSLKIINAIYNELKRDFSSIFPTHVFRYIITQIGNRDLVTILNEANYYIDTLTSVNTPIGIFIDKIDQGFSEELKNEKLFWHFAQASLSEASHIICTRNSHIKVNYAIRMETFDGIEDKSDLFMQIKSRITTLNYSKDDCKKLFDLYISCLKKEYLPFKNDFSSLIGKFCGCEHLPHSYINDIQSEDTFNYIYRHTLGNPRDLMFFGSAIFLERNGLFANRNDKNYFKQIIRKQGEQLIRFYFGQLVNLTELSFEEFREYISLFNTNVFNQKYLIMINRYFNSLNERKIANKEFSNAQTIVLKLLNLGLIGSSNVRNINEHFIDFNLIQDGTLNISNAPKYSCFFFHPILTDYVRKLKFDNNEKFECFNSFIVDYEAPLREDYEKTINKFNRRLISLLPKLKIFISSTCYDLHANRVKIAELFEKEGFECLLSDRNDGAFLYTQCRNSHDACYEAVAKADIFLFIQFKRYGSTYSGLKYKDKIVEIQNIVQMENVSISCLELYSAYERNIKRYHFIFDEIQKLAHKYEKEKLGEEQFNDIPEKERPIDKYSGLFVPKLVTKLKNDNWIEYVSLIDENEIVKKVLSIIENGKFNNR